MARLYEEKDHAQLYASYRPSYPDEIYKNILAYHSEKCHSKHLALDIGCGSGQSTLALSPYFEKVIGIDISEAQISQARHIPDCPKNVSFKVLAAEDLTFIQSDSVDLITVAVALHWLDLEKFYCEAKRVLCHNGTIAVYSYGWNLHLDNEEAEDFIITGLYQAVYAKGGYIHPRITFLQSFFDESFTLPFNNYHRVPDIYRTNTWSMGQLEGFLASYSAYRAYLKDHPDSTLLKTTMQRIKDTYGKDCDKVVITWPLILLLGRN